VIIWLFHRRRAERLARLLDEPAGDTHDEELAGYVRLTGYLARGTSALADPGADFRTSLRALLMATAEREDIRGRPFGGGR
jgi:hypothetical protein